MNHKRKIAYTAAALALAAVAGIGAWTIHEKGVLPLAGDQKVELCRDVTVKKFRENNGVVQYRRWNETRGVWVDPDWIDAVEATVTSNPYPGQIAIDEAHFGDERFCRYLKKKFDSDGNGYFSELELKWVSEIDLGQETIIDPYCVLKGFGYFAKLKRLCLNSAYSVEITDVPELSYVSVGGYGGPVQRRIGDLIIENCPELSEVFLNMIIFRKEEEQESCIVRIKDCTKPLNVEFSNSIMYRVEMTMLETPNATLRVRKDDGYGAVMKHMTLDSWVFLEMDKNQPFEAPYFDMETADVVVPDNEYVEWVGAQSRNLTGGEDLIAFLKEVQSGFFFEVEKVEPTIVNEEGQQGYLVFLNHSNLKGDCYYFQREENSSNEKLKYYGDSVLIYSDEPLEESRFRIDWGEIRKLDAIGYSPYYGFDGCWHKEYEYGGEIRNNLNASVVYETENRTECLGNLIIRLYYSLDAEKGFTPWSVKNTKRDDEGRIVSVTKEIGDVWMENMPLEYTPEQDEIPITEDYFGGMLFRNYLKETFDRNHNGYLSLEERGEVKDLQISRYELVMEQLYGFSYFPNLTTLCIDVCRQLVCKDCPELMYIAVFNDGGAEVITENCPKLKKVLKGVSWPCEGGLMALFEPEEYWKNYPEY